MYTEKQAKEKWCPFARAALRHGGRSFNRNNADGPETKCIGSACMAWRLAKNQRGDGPIREVGSESPPARVPGYQWHRGVGGQWGLFPDIGYCGLAGEPSQ